MNNKSAILATWVGAIASCICAALALPNACMTVVPLFSPAEISLTAPLGPISPSIKRGERQASAEDGEYSQPQSVGHQIVSASSEWAPFGREGEDRPQYAVDPATFLRDYDDQNTKLVSFGETPSIWPIEGHITVAFGNVPNLLDGTLDFHDGIDFSASKGTPVVAAEDGVVSTTGWIAPLGKYVVVDHGRSGLQTRYGHLTEIFARPGQDVRKGEVVGRAGETGNATGPGLHYAVVHRGTPVNPSSYLTSR